MRLESVKLVLPSRGLANDEAVALGRQQRAGVYVGDLDRLLAGLRALLARSGARRRYWLAPGEEPLALVASAVQQALDAAACRRSDIDLLICASVDRGFVEPA